MLARYIEAIRQTDAIFALEGFAPTDLIQRTDVAVLCGRVTRAQVAEEIREYASANKTLTGFIESRTWA
jgi:hypothetical protein